MFAGERLRGCAAQPASGKAEGGDRGDDDRASHDRVLSGAGGHQKLKPGWAAAGRAGCCCRGWRGGGGDLASRRGGGRLAGAASATVTPGATMRAGASVGTGALLAAAAGIVPADQQALRLVGIAVAVGRQRDLRGH